VRTATAADARAIARVQVAAWRAAYDGIVPRAFLDGMLEEEWAERRRGNLLAEGAVTLVAEEAGAVAGFVFAGPPREVPPGYDAEVYALYVLPGRQGRGIGGALLRRAAEALAGRGRRSLVLWVLRDNAGGRAFYARLGGREVGEKSIRIGGASLPEVAVGWGSLGALLAPRGPPGQVTPP
jgi:ribosomal protein S18 acetylase RimI-like enzyme